MNRLKIGRLALALAMVLGLRFAPSAEAAWSGFASLAGDIVTSDISCAPDGAGTAVCAALGTSGTMMVARYNGSSWGAWTHLTTVLAGAPSCTPIRTGQVICAARTANLQMAAYLWNGSTWSGSLTVQSGLLSDPSCAALSGGKAVCAAGGNPTGIIAAVYSGTGWSSTSWTKPSAVSDSLFSGIRCAPDDVGHAICAYLSKNSTTTVREFTTSWSAAINIGGTASNPPICTDTGVGGKVACFATGTDSGLYAATFKGGSFVASGWSSYGGFGGLVGSYSCTQDGQKAGVVKYVCGVVGLTTSGLFTNEYDGSNWGGWTARGTSAFIRTPSCIALNTTVTPGKVMCVLVSSGNKALSITGP